MPGDDFWTAVLGQYGPVAVIVLGSYVMLGFALRRLWERVVERENAMHALHQSHRQEIELIRQAHARDLAEHQEQLRSETRYFAERLASLQEKRTDEMRELLTKSVAHIAETQHAVDKITDTMAALRDVMRGG